MGVQQTATNVVNGVKDAVGQALAWISDPNIMIPNAMVQWLQRDPADPNGGEGLSSGDVEKFQNFLSSPGGIPQKLYIIPANNDATDAQYAAGVGNPTDDGSALAFRNGTDTNSITEWVYDKASRKYVDSAGNTEDPSLLLYSVWKSAGGRDAPVSDNHATLRTAIAGRQAKIAKVRAFEDNHLPFYAHHKKENQSYQFKWDKATGKWVGTGANGRQVPLGDIRGQSARKATAGNQEAIKASFQAGVEKAAARQEELTKYSRERMKSGYAPLGATPSDATLNNGAGASNFFEQASNALDRNFIQTSSTNPTDAAANYVKELKYLWANRAALVANKAVPSEQELKRYVGNKLLDLTTVYLAEGADKNPAKEATRQRYVQFLAGNRGARDMLGAAGDSAIADIEEAAMQVKMNKFFGDKDGKRVVVNEALRNKTPGAIAPPTTVPSATAQVEPPAPVTPGINPKSPAVAAMQRLRPGGDIRNIWDKYDTGLVANRTRSRQTAAENAPAAAPGYPGNPLTPPGTAARRNARANTYANQYFPDVRTAADLENKNADNRRAIATTFQNADPVTQNAMRRDANSALRTAVPRR